MLTPPSQSFKRGSREGRVDSGVVALAFFYFGKESFHWTKGPPSCHFYILISPLVSLFFCQFSLVWEVSSLYDGATCSLEHTATCWRRGINAPLKSRQPIVVWRGSGSVLIHLHHINGQFIRADISIAAIYGFYLKYNTVICFMVVIFLLHYVKHL